MNKKKGVFSRPANLKKDPKDSRDFLFKNLSKDTKLSIPNKVNWTRGMSSVKDQGNLGSCVAFAISALKEWQESKEHNEEVATGKKDHREGKEYNYSESWIYWNCKKIDEWPGEDGTSLRAAMRVLNKIGVPTESAWPYSDVNIGEPKSWANMVARWAVIDSYWRLESPAELTAALSEAPVPIGIAVFEEIYTTTDGIIKYPSRPDQCYGGHAVCAVGYNESTRLVKFKNSWGPDWGKNGYGFLSYDYIRDFLWDAWICKDAKINEIYGSVTL